jgi:colanic acid/amylovoran biosynthesis glycosyltransferase
VEDGVAGLLAPERDPNALARHVHFLIAHPAKRNAMAIAGRQVVEREYDADKLTDRLLALYEEVSCEAAARPPRKARVGAAA